MSPSRVTPLHNDLDFNAPLSDAGVARIIQTLQPLDGAQVVEIGCGWAELLLRIAAADPSVRGTGIDLDEAAIAHGRANAGARGLADRVDLRVEDAGQWTGPPVDVAICVGATHAWGGTADALKALHQLIRPGGRILLGEGFWRRRPDEAAMSLLDGWDADEFGSLADLVDLTLAHGLRPLAVAEASPQEWDAFESGYALGWERWLQANPDDPDVEKVRAEADQHRRRWLRGYRNRLGFAYLTLIRPA